MMRVLALVPGGISDQLLFFPTLDSLKQQYPQSIIDVVVEPRSAGAYRVCPWVRNVLKYDFQDQNSLADWGNLIGKIRDPEYDVVISLGTSFSDKLLLWLSGIPVRIAFVGVGDFLLSNPIPLNPNQYAPQMYHDLLKGMNIRTQCPALKVTLPKGDLDWADNAQKRLGIKDSGYILIHTGSTALSQHQSINKNYPVENWLPILKDVQAKLPNLPIVVLRTPEEDVSLVEALTAKLSQIVTISPPDVGKLAAIAAAANLLICPDSDTMQIGVAVGTAMVTLFGATDPAGRLPPQSKNIKVVKSPAGKPITAIAPQDVLAAIWSQ